MTYIALFKSKKCLTIGFMLLLTIVCRTPAHSAIADYAGTYNGTFDGDSRGIWIFFVESSGEVDTLSWSTSSDSFECGTVTIDENGHVWGRTDLGTLLDVSITDTGRVSGTYEGSQNSGTIEGDRQTETSNYAGTYSGLYSTGDSKDNGKWQITIESSGRLSGSMESIQIEKTVQLQGGINDQGELIAWDQEDVGLTATIAEDDRVNGVWIDYGAEIKGVLSGEKTKASDDESGGCFISAVTSPFNLK